MLHHVERISGKTYGANEKDDISIRVITDHIRSTVFMVSDGILPSNEGRGYVLRRLLRRAARHGRMLGIGRPFLSELVDTVIASSEAGYPELREHEAYIKKVVGTEEERFSRTIDAGLSILNGNDRQGSQSEQIKGEGKKVLSGAEVFKLNDTFGFPLDLTQRDRGRGRGRGGRGGVPCRDDQTARARACRAPGQGYLGLGGRSVRRAGRRADCV